jgi:hypothetical protein
VLLLSIANAYLLMLAYQNCSGGFLPLGPFENVKTRDLGSNAPPIPPLVPSPTYGGKIVVSSTPGVALKAAVDDLHDVLLKVDGVNRELGESASLAPGISAIHLLLVGSSQAPADISQQLQGKGLEAFFVRATASQILIVGNDEQGLAHGVYFYLEQLGCRWLMPGEKWTIVPKRNDITLSMDRLVVPNYYARGYAGTGGYFSNLFGRQFKGSSLLATDDDAWYRRMRYNSTYLLGRAMGEAFITAHAAPYPDKDPKNPGNHTLQLHPEYLAKIDGSYSALYLPALVPGKGEYSYDAGSARFVLSTPPLSGTHDLNTIAKPNVANPAAVALWTKWIILKFREIRTYPGYGSFNVMPVEPADGYGYGNNVAELPGDGSGSDQTYFLANESAKAVAAEVPGASVVLLAYAGHADPPTFPLESNVIIQVTPYAFRGGSKTEQLSPDAFIALWGKKAKTLAMYDYWSIPDWSWEEPTFNFLDIPSQLRAWFKNNVKGVQAESTYGSGAMGIGHYVASHMMWDLSLDEKALIEEFYDKAFSVAKAPMKRLLERWAQSYKPLASELSLSFRDMHEAMGLAASDPVIANRVDDFARYLHYLRLHAELDNALFENIQIRNQKASALAEFLFDIDESHMVHTTRVFDLLLYRGPYPGLADEFHLHDPNTPGDPANGPGWARVKALTHAEVVALVNDGIAIYPPSDYTRKSFSGDLVPVAGQVAWQAPAGDPWGSAMPTIGVMAVDVTIPPGLTTLPLRVSHESDNLVEVRDLAGNVVFGRRVSKSSDGLSDEMFIPVSPGRYKLSFNAVGGRATGYFTFQTWRGVPLVLRDFLSPKGRGTPRLYFFVPRGTTKVVIYYPGGVTGGYGVGSQGPEIFDPSGTKVTTDLREGSKIVVANVSLNQDGQIWSIVNSISPNEPIVMLTTPQTFSFEPQVLMVPKGAL